MHCRLSLLLVATGATPLAAQDMGTQLRTDVEYARYSACVTGKANELNQADETVESTVRAAALNCDKTQFDLDWAIIQQVQQEIWKEGPAAISKEVRKRKEEMHGRASDEATVRLFDRRAKVQKNARNQ